ncbi:MAG: 3-phosphoshikimate 1-carboxyvinyltransferase [Candidatus Omnitrophota bacterium]
MISFVIHSVASLKGIVSLPGDKSIAHRSLIISSIAPGKTRIENFPLNQDCLATLKAFRMLGITITRKDNVKRATSTVEVFGRGIWGLTKPAKGIWAGDSGTTLRLISGLLSGQRFSCRLTAGKSLSRRPMLRVTEPLRLMGANIKSNRRKGEREEFAPLTIKGSLLHSITYRLPVPSAQVKSAILLAALFANGKTKIIEPISSRDHTERMLGAFQAGIKLYKNTILIDGLSELVSPKRIDVPGDLSSAAFFMVLGVLAPKSRILINKVSLNPSRTGVIRVLKRMGARIKTKKRSVSKNGGEPCGDVKVESSRLKGVRVEKDEIPSIIDELPVLMVAACLAKGLTIFEGTGELRVKETDRIRSMVENLQKMGADVRVQKSGAMDKIRILGGKELKGTRVRSFGDHRTAMSMIVAGLLASGDTRLDDISCINKSFPNFLNILNHLTEKS